MKLLKRLFSRKPIVIINFKTYKQGKDVLKLARAIEKSSKKFDYKIILGVQPTDIYELKQKTNLEIFSEHADYFMVGRNTGFILPEAIKIDGAGGTFLNHSEHPIPFNILKQTIARCKNIHLKTAVFVKNLAEAKKVAKCKPTYLIYEPPELVAGKISVSHAEPSKIKKFSEKVRMPFLVGAGIHSHEDIETALQLGAAGVAVSSAIVKARKPEKKLRDMLGG
ncbi:MAG: hypothetical protein RL557_282 [archaeon]|jgi:triosephosphate isomerase